MGKLDQESLFYDSLNDALREIVQSCGGAKAVGGKLWPTFDPERVGNKLRDCLNDTRPEKLSPEEVLFMLKMGKQVGCHAAINYLAREAGYSDPTPRDPEDEKVALQREFIAAAKHMSSLTEKLQANGLLKAVA